MGDTGHMAVEKKAMAVVNVVHNMARAASGNDTAAMYSVLADG